MNIDIMFDGSEQIHYQKPEVPIYITEGNLRNLSDMAAVCHWHEDVELLLPYKGYLSYNVNGQILHVAEGNAIFVNSRQMHFGFSADGTDCEYICICFKPDLLHAHGKLYEQYVTPILNNPALPCLLFEKEEEKHKRVLEIIRDIFSYKERERNLTLLGMFYELWQEIYDLAEVEQSMPLDINLSTLKQMVGFINLQYAEHISLARIAEAGGVCRSKCCQIFKKYMRQTPKAYVNSIRLEKAIELLRATDMAVTEIAFSTGFHSASYFTEVFTREKGCSPKEYRKRVKR